MPLGAPALRWSAALILAIVSGCSTGASEPPTTSPMSTSAIGPVATGAEPVTINCAHAIGDDPPSGSGSTVLDVIELPTAPGHPVLQAEPDSEGGYFAKTGIAVRADTTVRLTVAADQADVARIGWGSPAVPTTDLTIDCPGQGTPPSEWIDFAGGYFVDAPLCLELTVESGGRAEQVLIGVGVACPGQNPPS